MSAKDIAAREAKLARRKQAEDEQAKKNRSFRTKTIMIMKQVPVQLERPRQKELKI